MAKAKTYSGDLNDEARYSGEVSPEKRYRVMFQQNRAFELTVAGETYRFVPGTPVSMDQSVVEHPDFKQQSGLFSVVEVTHGE